MPRRDSRERPVAAIGTIGSSRITQPSMLLSGLPFLTSAWFFVPTPSPSNPVLAQKADSEAPAAGADNVDRTEDCNQNARNQRVRIQLAIVRGASSEISPDHPLQGAHWIRRGSGTPPHRSCYPMDEIAMYRFAPVFLVTGYSSRRPSQSRKWGSSRIMLAASFLLGIAKPAECLSVFTKRILRRGRSSCTTM